MFCSAGYWGRRCRRLFSGWTKRKSLLKTVRFLRPAEQEILDAARFYELKEGEKWEDVAHLKDVLIRIVNQAREIVIILDDKENFRDMFPERRKNQIPIIYHNQRITA